MLKKSEYKALQAQLIVPVVVTQIIQGVEPLDDVAEYTIDEIVSEMKPDTALLCLALSAYNLATHKAHFASARALNLFARNIMDDYGPSWLAYQSHTGCDLDEQDVRAQLVHIPEDLEALADLLDVLQADLADEDGDQQVAAVLCDILAAIARAHMISAEEELYQIQLGSLPRQAVSSGNVIVFPGGRP